MVALQTELQKRIAKDSEAIVIEQEAKKFFLAWRQVGARLDEHAKVCSLRWPLLLESQHWAAMANGSRLCAKATRTCLEFGHHSIQMQPTPPEFLYQCNPHVSRFRSICHTNATNTERNPRKCNLILCKNSSELHSNATQTCPEFGQIFIHMQPKQCEFHANIGGGTTYKERACVEVVHTQRVFVEVVHTCGSTKKTTIPDHPNTGETTVSMDMLKPS